MSVSKLTKDAILRVGEVAEVNGRKVFIRVDKNKNLSDIFIDGEIIKNIAVNSYIEIRKGFLSIIGKVDGERIEEERVQQANGYEKVNRNIRYLTVSLSGYIDYKGNFIAGTKELPLIGNEAYILTKNKIHLVHNLVGDNELEINIATTDSDDCDIKFPVDGLFNSHIAIFGNTGSGKSNTLASLYQALLKALGNRNVTYHENSRFILFDFNGEFVGNSCITTNKKVYNLSTRGAAMGDRIPLDEASLLNIEIFSILSDATEKTQKPFLKRAIEFYERVKDADNSLIYFKTILQNKVTQILQMSDKVKVDVLIDYLAEILPRTDENHIEIDLREGLEWNNTLSEFMVKPGYNQYIRSNLNLIPNTLIYRHIDNFRFNENLLTNVICFLYLQLISDVISNRAQNEHIAPAINKLKSKRKDIEKIFDTSAADNNLWEKNFIVINLNNVNLDMKKTIPLLLSKKVYSDHKAYNNTKSLNIIIDEAHNILSKESFREQESWKDYRLETFEEIIKEGRKFGVFVTISSQRPNDISATITSQAHNYFIHRLINQKDLATISSAVSYIDQITEESIPTLSTGTCIFSGVASQIPLKINIKELENSLKPKSNTLKFEDIIPDDYNWLL